MELVQFRVRSHVFFIRLIGRLEFSSSACLDTVIGWIKNDKSIVQVVVDLSVATSIDSTNLGLLAELGLYATQNHASTPILAAGKAPEVKQTLSQFQLNMLYTWQGDQEEFAIQSSEYIRVLGPKHETESVICERAIAAHKALINLSDANRVEFNAVMRGLKVERALLGQDLSVVDKSRDLYFEDVAQLEVNQPQYSQSSKCVTPIH